MGHGWLLTLAPILGMVSNVLVQIALCHLRRRRSPGPGIAGGAAAGLAVAALIAASAPEFTAAERMTWSALAYLGLAFGYWAFLNLNLTSLRIRVLKEILAAPGETLPRSMLLQRYADREMVERRLARLEAAGQVVRVGDRYVLRARGLVRVAWALRMIRRAIIPAQNARRRSQDG